MDNRKTAGHARARKMRTYWRRRRRRRTLSFLSFLHCSFVYDATDSGDVARETMGRRPNGFQRSLNCRTILFLVILLDKTVFALRRSTPKLVQHNTTLNGKARWNLTGDALCALSSSVPTHARSHSLFHIRPSVPLGFGGKTEWYYWRERERD